MVRFLSCVCGIFLLCVFAITGLIVARGRLNPDWARYFDHIEPCGNQLCILGIEPGITPADKGEAIIDGYAEDVLQDGWAPARQFRIGTTWVSYGVDSYNDYNYIPTIGTLTFGQIFVGSNYTDVFLGAFIARFGSPCAVDVGRNEPSFIDLYYPSIIVLIYPIDDSMLDTKLTPHTKIATIISGISYDPSSGMNCTSTSKWRGFRSFNDYYRSEFGQYDDS